VKAVMSSMPPGKLVDLALFDHDYDDRPKSPPLLTLRWREWRAEPELTFYPLSEHPATSVEEAEALQRGERPSHRERSGNGEAPARDAAPAPRSSEEEAPQRKRASRIPPRPSQPPGPRTTGEALIGDMFEGISDLHYLNDAIEGADFVLMLALEKVPSEIGLVSLFDIDKREFVVVRQTGGFRNALLLRLAADSELAKRVMEAAEGEAVIVSDLAKEPELRDARWKKIGTQPRSLVCASVRRAGRYLGLLELANPHDGKAYDEDDGHALAYLGSQFADFVEKHGVVLDPDVILASPEAEAD
jgi:hypothetical protein